MIQQYLSQKLPLVFVLRWLVAPTFAQYLRDVRIAHASVLGNHVGCMVLAIEDKSYKASASDNKERSDKSRNQRKQVILSLDSFRCDKQRRVHKPFLGRGILGSE